MTRKTSDATLNKCTTESALAAVNSSAHGDAAMGNEMRKALSQLQVRDDTGIIAFLNACESNMHAEWANHAIRAVNGCHKVENGQRVLHLHAKGKRGTIRTFSVDFDCNGRVPKTKFDSAIMVDMSRRGNEFSFKAMKPVRVVDNKSKADKLREYVERISKSKDEDAKALALKMLAAIK